MRSRTTLAIDDDVLAAARALAAQQRRSVGEALSDLARKGIAADRVPRKSRNGIPLLPQRGVVVTPELVNRLRDDEWE